MWGWGWGENVIYSLILSPFRLRLAKMREADAAQGQAGKVHLPSTLHNIVNCGLLAPGDLSPTPCQLH